MLRTVLKAKAGVKSLFELLAANTYAKIRISISYCCYVEFIALYHVYAKAKMQYGICRVFNTCILYL